MHDTWCWKEKTVDIEVTDKDLTGIKFIQTGYILKCSISHEIKLVSLYRLVTYSNVVYYTDISCLGGVFAKNTWRETTNFLSRMAREI